MVTRIQKVLKRMSRRDFLDVQETIEQVLSWDLEGLDVKKLQGKTEEYRVRRGSYRIIFTRRSDGEVKILEVERRDESTYT